MLGKLIKHEFIRTGRSILMIMAALAIITPLTALYLKYGKGFFDNLAATNPGFDVFNKIMIFLCTAAYIIAIIGAGITTFICLIYCFYKSMVSKESYLTHTLPVSTSSLLISKGLVALVWSVVSFIMTILSIGVFTKIVVGWSTHDVITAIDNTFRELHVQGITAAHITLFAVAILLSYISSITMIGASFAIGHRMSGHPILGAIVSYIGIYVVLQTVTSIFLGVFSGLRLINLNNMETPGAFYLLLAFLIVYNVITSIIFFFIAHYMFKKKLNI